MNPSPGCGSSSRGMTGFSVSYASSSTSRPPNWTARGCARALPGLREPRVGGPFPAALLAFPEVCRVDGEEAAMASVQASRVREQRLVDRYRVDDLRRGAGVEIDYMERGRRGGMTRAPGSGPTTAAGLHTPGIPGAAGPTRSPPLPPSPPSPPGRRARAERAAVLPDLRGVPGGGCAGSGVGAVRRSGGCGHGMHPQCWVMYMTHSAGGSRHGVGAHGRLHVQCPTCRRAVTGDRDHEHSPSGARVALSVGGEQFERLIVLGSEPGDPPVYIPRVPRIAFPEWEWGWWNTGTWQSGSSGSGWWDRPERDDDEDDAWSRWNRGRRAPRTGGYGGYGGADRQIPEDCPHRCGARAPSYQGGVDRGAYADPPNPAHP